MRDIYEGIEGIRQSSQPQAQPGDVNLVFHTYTGFLAWFTQTRHNLLLPPDQAKILLKRMLKHNLTWGLFVYGGIFVPILTLIEYYQQKKKIARAVQQGFPVIPK